LRDIDIVTTERLFANGQCALVQNLGIGVATLIPIQFTQIVPAIPGRISPLPSPGGLSMANVALKDIVWGGRIRRAWQPKVWAIAKEVATDSKTSYFGSMASSSQQTRLLFLDGGVSDIRGFFDSSSGMRFLGEHSQAYVLYRLGLNAKALMKGCNVPSLAELEKQLPKKGGQRGS
jgi:hypothetical protein